jgi:hypothetical protein
MAEAVVLADDGGFSSFPSELIQRGLAAIRRGDPASDLPAVVLICSSLAAAVGLRLPGLRIAAVAAESSDAKDDSSGIPRVAGVDNLLRSVTAVDIVIVDGGHGVVYVDPDADTLVHYQSMERIDKKRRVFLESPHLPAVTQDGRTVLVLAMLSSAEEAATALSEGADGLLLTSSAVAALSPEDWPRLFDDVGGKPLTLLAVPNEKALRSILASAFPLQLTIAVRADQANDLLQLRDSIARITDDLASEDIESAEVVFAALTDVVSHFEDGYQAVPASRVIVDARSCDATVTQGDLARCVIDTISVAVTGEEHLEDLEEALAVAVPSTVILATSIDSVRYLAATDVDSVAVSPGLVSATKDLIRSLPTADSEQ